MEDLELRARQLPREDFLFLVKIWAEPNAAGSERRAEESKKTTQQFYIKGERVGGLWSFVSEFSTGESVGTHEKEKMGNGDQTIL